MSQIPPPLLSDEMMARKKKGFFCPCCGLFVKAYYRKLNCNMALCLIHLYRNGLFDFVHIESFLSKNQLPRCGDFTYLKHYGFLEPLKEKRSDGSVRNGFYKITEEGIAFVMREILAPEGYIIFNNTLEGFYGKAITISKALGKNFNYDELMKINP